MTAFGELDGKPRVSAGCALVVLLLVIARGTDFTERGLDRAISSEYPVNAVNFLRRNPQPGPLYNNLGWGGFLMWYMPDFPSPSMDATICTAINSTSSSMPRKTPTPDTRPILT